MIDSLESFHLLPISLRTHENSKHLLALEKKQNLFINTSLLQFNELLLSNSSLSTRGRNITF